MAFLKKKHKVFNNQGLLLTFETQLQGMGVWWEDSLPYA